MAMKIKGITIELSADTTGLEKALKDINKSLSTTQKDLNAVNKALQLDPKNMDLVEQKQRLLAKAAEETTKKLAALKKAQDNLKDVSTEEGQRQYDALTREISKTETELKKLNKEQANFESEAAAAKAGASAFGQALSEVSEKAGKVAQATAAISAAAAGALVGMGSLVYQASKFANEMLTVSQQTGLSTDALQKMEYAAEQIDVPMETIVGAVKKMKSQLDDQKDIWKKLGVHIKDQKDEYRDIESIFFESVRALSQIENETERDRVAMELFGKSADELAGLIDDGGKALKRLGQEAEDVGAIVSEEDLQALGEFNNKLEDMKSQLKGAAAQAAVPVLKAMQPVVEAVSNAVRRFAEVLSRLDPKLVRIGVIALAVIASISPIAKIISGITSGMGAFLKLIPMMITGMQALNASFTAFASNPYVLIIGAIAVALVALGAAIYYCVENWDTLGPAVDNAVGDVEAGINRARESIENLGSDIGSALGMRVSKGITAIEGIAEAARDAFGRIPKMVDNVLESFAKLAVGAAAIVEKISDAFKNITTKAGKAGSDIMNAFLDGIKTAINAIIKAVQNVVENIQTIMNGGVSRAKLAGTRTGQAYASGLQEGGRYIPNSYSGGISGIFGGLLGGGNGGANGGAYAGELLGAINTLNDNIERMGAGNSATNVNVELVGSAKNIFDTVRVQNAKLQAATGYHALA